MVAHERLTEPRFTMKWLLAKRNSLWDVPNFLGPHCNKFLYWKIYQKFCFIHICPSFHRKFPFYVKLYIWFWFAPVFLMFDANSLNLGHAELPDSQCFGSARFSRTVNWLSKCVTVSQWWQAKIINFEYKPEKTH